MPEHQPAHTLTHGHGQAHGHAHDAALARMLELDAVVHHRYLVEMTTWLRLLATGGQASAQAGGQAAGSVERILDVGAGTGAGTLALAERFPAASIVAIDISDDMLHRVRELARRNGIEGRVSTERADVAADLQLGSFDLAWASASLHEVTDPDRAFANLYEAVRPGGLLAVVEMAAPPRVLPDGLPELEERRHHHLERARDGRVDHPDWSDAVARAGFETLATRTFTVDEPVDGSGPAGEYAHLYLERIAQAVRPHLDETDQELLARLLDDGPDSLRRRTDLRLRSTRTAWIARRP
jgi:SAM-dependent methyltransferase